MQNLNLKWVRITQVFCSFLFIVVMLRFSERLFLGRETSAPKAVSASESGPAFIQLAHRQGQIVPLDGVVAVGVQAGPQQAPSAGQATVPPGLPRVEYELPLNDEVLAQ